MLETGTRLGPYEILSPLGAGGMGEVYKARDTRLERIVAIKVLSPALAADQQFRDRFEREAKTISQLDHPNICAVYDVGEQNGTSFIVMQYLDGETLAARIEGQLAARSEGQRAEGKGQGLPVDLALATAIEIADALDKAHRAGVVHRDLKPGNVMLTKSGAKLLDFGLAKTGVPAVSAAGGSMLPTTPANITAQGTILGTFQYMAPEQLEGGDADARTDIFAFGAVVYEMVTGRKAFEGKSTVSLMGAILEREPAPLLTLAPAAPATLERVIKRCLAKDPDKRWQTASDLAHELRWIAESASGSEAVPAPIAATAPKSRKTSVWWKVATAAALVAAISGFAAAYLARQTKPAVVRFFIAPPDKTSFVSGGRPGASAAIAPDGRRIVFTVRDGAQRISLWIRGIDALTAQPLPGTDDASFPFWSPDSRWIAYFAHDKLMKVAADGGPPQTLCDAVGGRGGAWNRDGVILFGAGGPSAPNGTGSSPLSRVPSAGGQPLAATKVTSDQSDHRFPSFLPDGRHFFFYAQGGEASGVFLGSLDAPDSRRIISAESNAIYSSGQLLFVRQSTLLAQPFNLKTFEASGDPVPVAERVTRNFQGVLAFSVSDDGALAYGIGPSNAGALAQQLTWVDRQGKLIEVVGPQGTYRGIDLAPDGRRIAAHRHEGTGGDIWIIDGTRNERFTFDTSADNVSPIWSPDGEWITFSTGRSGKYGLYRKRANGVGAEELLLDTQGVPTSPTSWSPDGKSVVYFTGIGTQGDLFTLPLSGDRKPVPSVNTPANEARGQISPNGKWLAYQSQGATGPPDGFVRPFNGGDGKYEVSTGGGAGPRWRGDGRELFYLDTSAGPRSVGKLMAVDVGTSETAFERGSPHSLFDSQYTNIPHTGTPYHAFAVSRDGQRFLIPRAAIATATDDATAPVVVVLNWAAALK